MTIKEAMEARHSVRAYRDIPIPEDIRKKLDDYANVCGEEGGIRIFLRYDDPEGFDSRLAHYGNFKNVKNYIVLAGKKTSDFDLKCGYWGEKLVLYAQQLGLNTCWVALTFNKRTVKKLLKEGESLCMVISLGYGETQGAAHKGKSAADVADLSGTPDWFLEGVEAALLAPTAVNQQKFYFTYQDGQAHLKTKGIGSCLKTDLGIVKYHFEAVSNHPAVTD